MKRVGVTTGAFYGYYRSKEELFEALVGLVAEHFLNRFSETIQNFNTLSAEEQKKQMGNYSKNFAVEGIEFAYKHLNCMKLLLTASGGTRYEKLVVVILIGIRSSIKHFKGEGGCCGGSSISVSEKNQME